MIAKPLIFSNLSGQSQKLSQFNQIKKKMQQLFPLITLLTQNF